MAPQRGIPQVAEVLEPAQVIAARQVLDEIYVDDKVRDYIVALVHATRSPDDFGLKVGDWVPGSMAQSAMSSLQRLSLRCTPSALPASQNIWSATASR